MKRVRKKIPKVKQTKMNSWKEYLEKLFEDSIFLSTKNIEETLSGAKTLQEVQTAIEHLKESKAPGPDNIQTELLKLFVERTIRIITQFFNRICHTGEIPTEWLKSEFVAIPQKTRAKRCEKYRAINLKFINIIHRACTFKYP
ncbi:hypothetical protein Trydic_g11484 [Trypoxylus dichotomus]